MKQVYRVSGKDFHLFNLNKENVKKWKLSVRPGGWILAESSQGKRLRLMVEESRGMLSLSLEGKLWNGGVREERTFSTEFSTEQGVGIESNLIAQFPGKVRKILVLTGATVSDGDPLILVEAMKMEFTIRAPFHGKVKEIFVQEGQQLLPGDIFLDIETLGVEKALNA